MGRRGGGLLVDRRSPLRSRLRSRMRERAHGESVRPFRRKASPGPRGPSPVPCRPGDRDGRPRQRSFPRTRVADAGHARRRSLAGAAARAFPCAASGEFSERGLGSLDRRPGGECELLNRSRIRAFELDAQSKEVHVDIAAWIVSLGSGRIVADQIFTLRTPVASTDPANVAAAMDQAGSTVMTEIVAFVARKL